jgi:DNA/RNA endonuclease YhcR with UshA esterase domain
MLSPRGLALLLVTSLAAVAATVAAPGHAAGTASWPVSGGLVLAEVVTGGSSASDEYVEIYNAGPATADLGGCGLTYVTATGATTTRKVTFAEPLPLVPGAHLLVANSVGAFAASADATYAGGFSADGGTLLLLESNDAVIDAVSWGTATNTYVEGEVTAAPPARSSIERRPGGMEGNWQDTNDNAADWQVQPNPLPQSLASAPIPRPVPSGTAPSTPGPTAEPTAEPTSEKTAEPTNPEPTASGTPLPTEQQSLLPSSTPTATSTPAATPDPSAVPDATSIAAARHLAVNSRVHVSAVVTAPAGVLGSDSLIAVADASGGIFVRLPSGLSGIGIGQSIDAVGFLSAPYGQLEIRELDWLELGEPAQPIAPAWAAVPDVGESLEGSLVTLEGTVDSVTMDGNRLTVVLTDGQASVRALADPPAGVTKTDVVRGQRYQLTGIVGQHATATGCEDGYRIWLRQRSDVSIVADPTPGPTASTSAAAGSPTPRPSATPTPDAALHSLAGLVRGRLIDVEGVVTAAAGVIDWGGPTIVIDDGTGAVAVVLPAGVTSPQVGARVHVAGKVGSLHGGLRIAASLLEWRGEGVVPTPLTVSGTLPADLEWRLVTVCGPIVRVTHAGSRWRVDLTVGGHDVAVLGEPGAGISTAGLVKGRLAIVTGIVRRSTTESGVFLVLPRSRADLMLGPAPAASPSARTSNGKTSAASGASASPTPRVALTALSDLPAHSGEAVTVAGLVVGREGSTVTLDDGTGTVELGGSDAAEALSLLEVGDAVEVTGLVCQAADGWRIDVDPERILALSGTDSSWDQGEGLSTGWPSTPSAAPASLGAQAAGSGEAPAARSATRGLIGPASDQSPAIPWLAVLALVLVTAPAVALPIAAVMVGRLRRAGRPERPPRL